MRRIAAALATLCLLAGQTIFVGPLMLGADPSTFTATPLDPGSTFVGAKSTSGAIDKTDPALLGRTDSTPVNVMIKYDYDASASYTGGIEASPRRARAVTGQPLKGERRGRQGLRQYTANLTERSSRAPAGGAGLKVPSLHRRFGGVPAPVPANQIAALLKADGIAAVQQDTLEQPQDDNTAFIGATTVWPSLGGSANAAQRHRRRHRHRYLARASDASPTGGLGAPAVASRLPVRRRHDVAHLGPTFACNNKLIGAYAKTATYMAITAPTPRSSATTPPRCAPRVTPRATARIPLRPPPAMRHLGLLYGVSAARSAASRPAPA